ncbi:hypothetical protein DSO57_1038104 [Entomophthora muscae]|uniref:Uncharacterized protein n=2 Tax=Entomophthora muscae TaxID=34485 RepID=A0ACC2RDX0_9FUNG|nr:hypothetical protein DSO57_1038104 [Entomophthora muscae]
MSASERDSDSPVPVGDSDLNLKAPQTDDSVNPGLGIDDAGNPTLTPEEEMNSAKIKSCLALNRELQKRLQDRLKAICLAKQQNEAQLNFARQLIIKGSTFDKHDSQAKSMTLKRQDKRKSKASLIYTGDAAEDIKLQNCANYIYFPYFIDHRSQIPIDNRDSLLRQQVPPLIRSYAVWTINDRRLIANAVRAENSKLFSKKNQNLSGSSEIKGYANFVTYNVEGLDWDTIAEFVPGRTARECRIFWACYGHPAINKKQWDEKETELLVNTAISHEHRNWIKIATYIPRRTPIQCFREYIRFFHSAPNRTYWSKEEDEILTEAIQVYGERNWHQISLLLDKRNGTACLHRWRYALRPSIIRRRWNKEEDEALRKAVAIKGEGNWAQVYPLVPGRTDVQCRERWVNTLDPKLDDSLWSPHMDATLCSLINKHGVGRWSLFAATLKGKTDNQIWRRFKMLNIWGAVDHSVITHPSFCRPNSELYPTSLPVPPSSSPTPELSGFRRKRKAAAELFPFESKTRRPTGGGNTNYSIHSQGTKSLLGLRMHPDLDRGNAIPPCLTSVQLFTKVLEATGMEDSSSIDACPSLGPEIAADPEDISMLESCFQSIFAWPHQCANIEMNMHLLDKSSLLEKSPTHNVDR